MKIIFLAPLALLALAGCGSGKEQPATTEAAKALAVTGGSLVLPAVAGNPGAVYFTLTNGTAEAISLAAVSVEGATKAEMHETSGSKMTPIATLPVAPGESAAFARGAKHVMVFDLDPSLKPGGTTKVTLTFSGGKTVSAPLMVEPAGGDMGGMAH
jgi:copper(I)-binding protein